MEFRVRPLQAADVSKCVQIYFDAFQNPHSLACWPRTPGVRKFWEGMLCEELDDPGAHFLKVTTNRHDGNESEEIVAFAKWVAPRPGSAVDTGLPRWPQEADSKLCDLTFGDWARRHAELMGTRGHWCESSAPPSPFFLGKCRLLDTVVALIRQLQIWNSWLRTPCITGKVPVPCSCNTAAVSRIMTVWSRTSKRLRMPCACTRRWGLLRRKGPTFLSKGKVLWQNYTRIYS